MSLVWRKIQRANKKSSKYLFTITPQELLIVGTSKLEPESVVLVCMHRRRRIESKQRKWEGNFADPHRSLMVWPSPATDPLRIETTLYGDVVTGEYDDKDWTVVVEEITHKHKRHPIAAINLNMRLFIQSSTETRAELKLKLRPLRSDIIQCLLQALITSHLISENGKTTQSEVSSVSEEKAVISDVEPRKVGSLPDEKSLVRPLNTEGDSERQAKAVKKITADDESNLNGTDVSIEVVREEAVNSVKKAEGDRSQAVPLIPLTKFSSPQPQSTAPPSADFPSIDLKRKSIVESGMAEIAVSDAFIIGSETAEFVEQEQNVKPEGENSGKKIMLTEENSLEKEIAHVISTKSGCENTEVISKDTVRKVEEYSITPVEGEDLLSWCRRATKDYKLLKITDFRKSFRSGLGFCAIIHRYRPGLIGDYDQLSFTDRGRKENYAKAIGAAKILGVKNNLDLNQMMVLSSEANEENVRLFLTSLREVLEGKPTSGGSKSLKTNEHRRSASYNISESEALVMRELENLRKQREEEEAVDYSDVMDNSVTLSSTTEYATEVKNDTGDAARNGDQALFDETFGNNDHLITGLVSPTVATRHEELKKKRQTLNTSVLETSEMVDKERAKRLRKEARRLMENAALEGRTTLLNSSSCQPVASTSSEANILLRSFESEPKNDLHCLEVVTPQVNIYKFRKVEASPNVQRKKYTPIIPAFKLPSQRISTSSSDVRNAVPTTFDRVRRYGSMRSQELAETVAKMAGLSPVAIPSTSSTEATPTRKLVSRWEKYSSNVEKIQEEQKRVSARLAEVSKKDEELSELTKSAATSDEEEKLLNEHMQLLVERDALVRRGESLNVLEQLADVEGEIATLQKELGRTSSSEGVRSKEDKDSIDKMMEDLVELVNRKDQLSQKLIMLEAEDEEMDDRDRRTLEAAAHFKRGFEQPISASKRLITWFRS